MAASVCPHCQNQTFELQEGQIGGIHRKLLFVQCTGCGAPFGAVESHEAALGRAHDARLQSIEKQIQNISAAVGHIGRIVGALASQHSI